MRNVRVAALKARLNEYLRAVQRGRDFVITERGQPIARIVPYAARPTLIVRGPVARFETLGQVPLPAPVQLGGDPVDLLLEDRRGVW